MNISQTKAYNKVLKHRKNCPKWSKEFCLECFGGGLTLFTKEIKYEIAISLKKKIKNKVFKKFAKMYSEDSYELINRLLNTDWRTIPREYEGLTHKGYGNMIEAYRMGYERCQREYNRNLKEAHVDMVKEAKKGDNLLFNERKQIVKNLTTNKPYYPRNTNSGGEKHGK